MILWLVGCSQSQVSELDECVELCHANALCTGNDNSTCEVTCRNWTEVSNRYSCQAELEAVLWCAREELSCGPCREFQQAWAQCTVDGTMSAAASLCNTWTCMSFPVSPTPHDECVSIMQEWLFLDEGAQGTWLDRSISTDDCVRCTEENFGHREYGDCSFGEAEWKTVCPVCRD